MAVIRCKKIICYNLSNQYKKNQVQKVQIRKKHESWENELQTKIPLQRLWLSFYSRRWKSKLGANDRFVAFTLYRKGLSLRSIGEIIGTSNVLILYWIRSIGWFVQEKCFIQAILHHLKKWIYRDWWNVALRPKKNVKEYGYGLLTLVPNKESLPVKSALVVPQHWRDYGGDRIKLLKPAAVCTDEYKVYRKVIPANILIQSKKYTQQHRSPKTALSEIS